MKKREFNFGERGSGNWVRAYRDNKSGRWHLDYFDENGVRRRPQLKNDDGTYVANTKVVKQRARLLSDQFARLAAAPAAPPVFSLDQIIDFYSQEVTPRKGSDSKRSHDARAARVFRAYFNSQEAERQMQRSPDSLDRVDWDGFIHARRTGSIEGWEATRDRQVQYDLTWLVGVLNWATGTKKNGAALLLINPWSRDVRKAQAWERPKERSPRRIPMTDEIRELLVSVSPHWQFEAALLLERHTRRRNNAIRQLLWSDIDLIDETAQWRSELDKARRWVVTALFPESLAVLRRIPRGIGDTPVFPAEETPSQPTSRHTFQNWLRKAKKRLLAKCANPEERARMKRRLLGVGFHSEKRSGIRDPKFRDLPAAVQESIAGTDFDTLRKTYDDVTVEDQKEAINRGREDRTESQLAAQLAVGG